MSGRDKIPLVPLVACNIGSSQHVVDGGSLIYRIPWSKKHMSWGKLFSMYAQYVLRVYGPSAIICFDGYPAGTLLRQKMKHI